MTIVYQNQLFKMDNKLSFLNLKTTSTLVVKKNLISWPELGTALFFVNFPSYDIYLFINRQYDMFSWSKIYKELKQILLENDVTNQIKLTGINVKYEIYSKY